MSKDQVEVLEELADDVFQHDNDDLYWDLVEREELVELLADKTETLDLVDDFEDPDIVDGFNIEELFHMVEESPFIE